MKTKMSEDFYKTLQRFVAVDAIGVSAMRGQISGTMHAAQNYCTAIDLTKYSDLTEEEFKSTLDKDTEGMLDSFGFGGFRPWGTARKALNLFLRTALYNKYLSEKYNLEGIERYLEIPLDSAVSKGLRNRDQNRVLPSWSGLTYLVKSDSEKYQRFALNEAEKRGINRVHLDIFLWLENR
jgi:hypothetical protein